MSRKNKEIRQLSEQDTKSRLDEVHKEMLKLGGQRATGASQKNNQQIRTLRRTRARLLTRLQIGGTVKR